MRKLCIEGVGSVVDLCRGSGLLFFGGGGGGWGGGGFGFWVEDSVFLFFWGGWGGEVGSEASRRSSRSRDRSGAGCGTSGLRDSVVEGLGSDGPGLRSRNLNNANKCAPLPLALLWLLGLEFSLRFQDEKACRKDSHAS